MTHETSTAASERAAIMEAQLTSCRIQRDEAIARRDELAGENERLRAIEAAVREWVRRNRVCDVAENDGALDGDGAMPDGTDCQSWCSEAWDAIEAALASAPAGESEVARLREELRIVSRYAARLYDAARDVARSLGSYTTEWTDDAISLDKALTIDCASHVKSGNPCSVGSRWPDCTDDTCALRIWHAALQRGREAE